MVLHDLNMAARYADWILAMKDGRKAAFGTPQDGHHAHVGPRRLRRGCRREHRPGDGSPIHVARFQPQPARAPALPAGQWRGRRWRGRRWRGDRECCSRYCCFAHVSGAITAIANRRTGTMTMDANAGATVDEPAFRPYLVHVSRAACSPRISCASPSQAMIWPASVLTATTSASNCCCRCLMALGPIRCSFEQRFHQPRRMVRAVAGIAAGRQYTIRTYTIRKAQPERGEVVVDFVIHEGAGPAGAFAARAKPGARTWRKP